MKVEVIEKERQIRENTDEQKIIKELQLCDIYVYLTEQE